MLNNSLSNKNLIIAGASGGIGYSLVKKLIHLKTNIVYTYNQNRPLFNSKENIRELKADLTKASEWDKLIRLANYSYGNIDIMINCTGLMIPGSFLNHTDEQIIEMINTNISSVMIGTHKTMKFMIRQGFGHIINLGSVGGLVPMPYSSIYCATKFALRGFTHSVAQEIRNTKISVSLVSPGPVNTKMLVREAEHKKTAIAFINNALKPEKVTDAIISIIHNPKTEIIVPTSILVTSKAIFFFPKLFSKSYKLIEKIGYWRKRFYLRKQFELSISK